MRREGGGNFGLDDKIKEEQQNHTLESLILESILLPVSLYR